MIYLRLQNLRNLLGPPKPGKQGKNVCPHVGKLGLKTSPFHCHVSWPKGDTYSSAKGHRKNRGGAERKEFVRVSQEEKQGSRVTNPRVFPCSTCKKWGWTFNVLGFGSLLIIDICKHLSTKTTDIQQTRYSESFLLMTKICKSVSPVSQVDWSNPIPSWCNAPRLLPSTPIKRFLSGWMTLMIVQVVQGPFGWMIGLSIESVLTTIFAVAQHRSLR